MLPCPYSKMSLLRFILTQATGFENETAQKYLPELTLQVQGPKFHGSVIMYITEGIMFKKHSTIRTIPTFINRPLNGYLKKEMYIIK